MLEIELIVASIPMLVALVLSALKYRTQEPRALRLLTWILLVTFLSQAIAYFYSKYVRQNNHFIFNMQIILVYGGYIILYYCVLQRRWYKLTAMMLGIAFVITYLFRIFIFGSLFKFDAASLTIGELATLCCCLLFLAELLTARHRINLFAIPMFLITVGVMIAVIGDFLYMAAFDYILAHNLDPGGELMGSITTLISVVEYSCFAAAFWPKRPQEAIS